MALSKSTNEAIITFRNTLYHNVQKSLPIFEADWVERHASSRAGDLPGSKDATMTTHEDEDLSPQEVSPSESPKPKRRSPAPESRSNLPPLTAEQRVFIPDSWRRSELSAETFAPLVGVPTTTLYGWKKRSEAHGPAELSDRKRGQRPSSRLSEPVHCAVLMLERAHPDRGCDRLHDVHLLSEGYGASPSALFQLRSRPSSANVSIPTAVAASHPRASTQPGSSESPSPSPTNTAHAPSSAISNPFRDAPSCPSISEAGGRGVAFVAVRHACCAASRDASRETNTTSRRSVP